ncbi:MAG: hypothetical protein HZB53_21790 [Chloroflexi bacterium]|nr:hypothetical protein [Chloroflexota bacterium]
MANFVLIYMGGSQPASEAEGKAVMADWTAWFGKLGSSVVDGGNPFTPVAKMIGPDGAVSDIPANMLVTGYSVIKAGSLNEAVELSKGCPQLKAGGSIGVFEIFPVM